MNAARRHMPGCLTAGLFVVALAAAQVTAGGGDECVGATPISGEGTFAFDNELATTGLDDDACPDGDGFDNDVWYCWTADCDGLVHIHTCEQTTVDTMLAVYDGCTCPPSGASQLDCNDDLCEMQSSITFEAVNGMAYLLRVASFPGQPGGSGAFIVDCLGPGDVTCDDAVYCQTPDQMGQGVTNRIAVFSDATTEFEAVESFVASRTGSIQGLCFWGFYTDESAISECGPGEDGFSVTYYNDDAGGLFPGSLKAGPFVLTADVMPTDTIVDTTLGPLAEWFFEVSHTSVFVQDGECYWVEIVNDGDGSCTWAWAAAPPGDGRSAQDDGNGHFLRDFDLGVCVPIMADACSVIEPPANDDCAEAEAIAGEGTFAFNTFAATTDGRPHASCFSVGSGVFANDVWFCWTAECNGAVTLDLCALTSTDSALAVYSGCGCPVTEQRLLACNDDSVEPECGLNARLTFNALSGQSYLIRVGVFEETIGGPGMLEITCAAAAFEEPDAFDVQGAPNIEATGDFNGDRLQDIVIAIPDDRGRNGVVQVFLNLGNDGFGQWLGLSPGPTVPVGRNPSGIAVGDFDDDSLPDVAVTNADDDTVSVLINSGAGDGTFNPAQTIIVGNDPSSIAAVDFDMNGVPDLAVTNRMDDTLVIYENTTVAGVAGGSLFMLRQTLNVAALPTSVCPDDVDNDKDVDLMVTSATAGIASVFRNTPPTVAGGPVYDPPLELTVDTGPVDIAVADIDDNGFVDILTANNAAGTFSLLLNQDGTNFDAAVNTPTGATPVAIEALDLDQDGDPDIAVVAADTGIGGQSLKTIENTTNGGPATFEDPFAIDLGADPNFVVAADLNEDTVFDLVTVNVSGGPGGGSVTALITLVLPTCLGDATDNGVVDVDDLVYVILRWDTSDPFADVNNDGIVNVDDIVVVILTWGPCPAPPRPCPPDVTGDGVVNVDDLIQVVIAWGDCPDPPATCPSDVNDDGVVNVDDVVEVILNWGDCD